MKVVSIAILMLLTTVVIHAQAVSAVQIFMPDGSRPERELRFTLTRTTVASKLCLLTQKESSN